MLVLADLFFDEDSAEELCLSNVTLFEALCASAAALRADAAAEVSDRDLKNILRARKDVGVWQKGLEPKFMKFAASVQPSSPIACLLSIL